MKETVGLPGEGDFGGLPAGACGEVDVEDLGGWDGGGAVGEGCRSGEVRGDGLVGGDEKLLGGACWGGEDCSEGVGGKLSGDHFELSGG